MLLAMVAGWHLTGIAVSKSIEAEMEMQH